MKTARQGIIDGGAKGKEIFAKCGEQWRAMSAEEKEPYEQQAAKNKEAYNTSARQTARTNTWFPLLQPLWPRS